MRSARTALFFFCALMVTGAAQGREARDAGEKGSGGHRFFNNALAVGRSVTFEGKSNEDLLFAGMGVNILGDSEKDLYALGDEVLCSGIIRGNCRIIGRAVRASGGMRVSGNANLVGPDVRVAKDVVFERSVKIWTNEAFLDGSYGSLYVRGKTITFSPGCRVSGNLVVESENRPVIPATMKVGGTLTFSRPLVSENRMKFFSLKYRKLFSFLGLCFPFILMMFFMPNLFFDTVEVIDRHPVGTFFTGLAGFLGIPVFLLLVMLTVVGAPLGLILITYYVSILYLSRGFFAVWCGKKIFSRMRRNRIQLLLATVVGLALFVGLTSIPHAGIFIQFAFILFGLGGLIRGRFVYFNRLRREHLL